MTVLQAFVKLFGMLNTLLSLIGLVQGNTAKAAQENVPFGIDTVTSETWALASDSAVGLAAIKAELLIIDAHIATVDSSLAAAIAAAQQTGLPVTLPVSVPTGYGGSTPNDTWSYIEAGSGRTMGYWMVQAGVMATFMGDGASLELPSAYVPGYLLSGEWANEGQPGPSIGFQTLVDPSTILGTDVDYSSWLVRVYGVGIFAYDSEGRAYLSQSGSTWQWTLAFGPVDFAVYKAAVFGAGTLPSATAPVWPGLALVTLGTPVALSTGLTITLVMDGVIVDLTSEPAKAGFFTFDDVNSYRNLGALSFFDDDNNQEPPQSLGFTSAQYTCKTMARAAGVKVRCVGGVVGTITPWVIA